jgi:hydrogenase maturation protease
MIIGYGNPLRGDDALGWHAAARLAERLPAADVRACHQLTPELAEPLSRCGLAVFIDAACDQPAAEVRARRIDPASSGSLPFTHQLIPEILLGLAARLYGSSPAALLFTVGVRSLDHGGDLSAEVQSKIPELLELITRKVHEETEVAGR